MYQYNPQDRIKDMEKIVDNTKFILGSIAFISGLIVLYKKFNKGI